MFFLRRSNNKVVIRPRAEHPISRKNIAPEALKVLYRLNEAGFKGYLVGGSVRDLLLGRQPKDFDVSTDASPREVKRLFRNCFLVGRRFRLAHVVFGDKVIETSTFRKQPDDTVPTADENAPGALYQSSDNTFGTPEEDAKRRDFTINGLFYDIKTFNIIDYVGGLHDLDQRLLRSIGDPNVRFREDPVRMMRAVRLAARLDMTIERKTYRAISTHAGEIAQASPARVCEEIFRLFGFSKADATFRLLWDSRLIAPLLPNLDAYIKNSGRNKSPLWGYLQALDRFEQDAGENFSNGLHLAVLAYPSFKSDIEKGAAEAAGRGVQRLDIAKRCLEELNATFKPPKSIYFHAVHLLDDQQRFDAPPPPGRRIRAARAAEFAEALWLARICCAAEGRPLDNVEAWQKLMPPSTGQDKPAAESGTPRRHPRRFEDDGHPGNRSRDRPSPDDERQNNGDADDSGSSEDATEGEGEATPRSRRRRRGGRRHRRKSSAEGGANPASGNQAPEQFHKGEVSSPQSSPRESPQQSATTL